MYVTSYCSVTPALNFIYLMISAKVKGWVPRLNINQGAAMCRTEIVNTKQEKESTYELRTPEMTNEY